MSYPDNLGSLDTWGGEEMLNTIIPIAQLSNILVDFSLYGQTLEYFCYEKHNVSHYPDGNNAIL